MSTVDLKQKLKKTHNTSKHLECYSLRAHNPYILGNRTYPFQVSLMYLATGHHSQVNDLPNGVDQLENTSSDIPGMTNHIIKYLNDLYVPVTELFMHLPVNALWISVIDFTLWYIVFP